MCKREKTVSDVEKRDRIFAFGSLRRVFRPVAAVLAAAVFFNSAAAAVCAVYDGTAASKNGYTSSAKEKLIDSVFLDDSADSEDTAYHGWIVKDDKAYYIGSDGERYTGSHSIDGETYRFTKDGLLEDGWVLIGNIRYHFSDCVMSKGEQTIDGVYRYINDDGTMFVRWYKDESGNWHYYDIETGAGYRGWREIDGKRYYFDRKGILARDTVIDGVKIGADGSVEEDSGTSGQNDSVSDAYEVTDDMIPASLKKELDSILSSYGSTPLDIYNYVHGHYKYKYAVEGTIVENARHMLDYGTGSCYNFAALTYLLFKRAGYDVRYVTGKGWQPGSYHCWIMAYFDGGWYFVDSLYVRSAKLTAKQLRELGYEWDESAYPS